MARKHTTRLIAFLSSLALLGFACTEEDPSTRNSPMEQKHVSGSDCDNEAATAGGAGRSEGELMGDVDGDGNEDGVYIALDPEGVAGCRSFLVVDAGRVVYTTPVDPSGTPRSLQEPSLHSLAEINREAGLEVVVNVESGASTQFVAAFTLAERLEQMTVTGKGPGPFANGSGQDDLFAFGGSVGHLEGVDCADNGMVHMVSAIPEGDTAEMYRVEHRFFLTGGSELILDKSLNQVERAVPADLGELPGLAGAPFGSCD